MLNFTVGPVMSSESIRAIGGAQIPYFRTSEFSEIMLESERLVKTFTGAEEEARAVFLTGSGTAAMEAAVMNCFTPEDKVLVVNGGTFGARFSQALVQVGMQFVSIVGIFIYQVQLCLAVSKLLVEAIAVSRFIICISNIAYGH